MATKITPVPAKKGLGGGTMQSYLDATCPSSQLLTLEASPAVLAAAQRFFGFSGGVARDQPPLNPKIMGHGGFHGHGGTPKMIKMDAL